MTRRPLLLGSLAALGAALSGCSGKDAKADTKAQKELPQLSFKDGEKNLMLTWIDGHGTTHTDASVEPIPTTHREMVRVLVSDSDVGAGDPIYLADVSKPEADGGYIARSFPRSAWEDEIDKRRREPNKDEPLPEPKLLRAPPPSGPDGAGPAPTQSAPPPGSSAPQKLDPTLNEVNAVVYGAEWCGPCHQALAHLKRRGVKTTFKDIEKDPGARGEVRTKLESAHRRPGSIPVIDINGRILVGFSAEAIDDVLSKLKRGTAL